MPDSLLVSAAPVSGQAGGAHVKAKTLRKMLVKAGVKLPKRGTKRAMMHLVKKHKLMGGEKISFDQAPKGVDLTEESKAAMAEEPESVGGRRRHHSRRRHRRGTAKLHGQFY